MKSIFSDLRFSRRISVSVLLGAAILGVWVAAPEVHSQAPAASAPNPAVTALLVKLKSQQDALVANQTKIEAQTALLKEDLRQAKIYSARGGSGHR